MKRQYQPSKIRRKRQHGFLNRNSSKSGKATLRNRRREGRQRLTPV
jgi:large subunit ribosomal protein L34